MFLRAKELSMIPHLESKLRGYYKKMQLEVGAVVDGVVTGLTNFGAFVSLPEGKSGMVHISEVSSSFVKEIKDFLSEGQEVKVKIISIGDDGKIGLSIRKAVENTEKPVQQAPRKPRGERRPNVWQGQQTPPPSNSFEDMMARFKQESDEKMSAFKKANDGRRGGGSRRGGRG